MYRVKIFILEEVFLKLDFSDLPTDLKKKKSVCMSMKGQTGYKKLFVTNNPPAY